MVEWRKYKDTPPSGAVVVIAAHHWKQEGWLSVELNFGKVSFFYTEDGDKEWCVENLDSRGNGTERWDKDDIDSWAYPMDVISKRIGDIL